MASGEIELAETFGDIARALLSEPDVEATLARITDIAVELIEPCDHAGIDIVEGRQVRAVAPTDEVARLIDAIQTEVGEGPCLSALEEHEQFNSDDLSTEERWPTFAARAHRETGVRSVMGFRLFAEENTMGALDMYSTAPNAFDDDMRAIGSVLAAHAAVAMASAREHAQMERGMETRDIIGQAKGMLMVRSHVDETEAFDILRRASQRLNIKLRDVAWNVVHLDDSDPG